VHPERSLTNSLSTHMYDQKKGRDCYILLRHLACVRHAAQHSDY